METADVIVAGAGIIGLTAALEMARSGLRVQVLEKGRAMSEASWAAAGMLAAHDPEHPAGLVALAALSGKLYPQYLRTVEELSGRSVRLRTRATLHCGNEMTGEENGRFYRLSSQEASERLPGLTTLGRPVYWMEEASLDPRDLCVALPLAAVAAGIDLRQGTEVLAVESKHGSVSVTTRTGTLQAGAFVNCCGAWAGTVQHGELRQPASTVEPRKGQMLSVQLAPPRDLAVVLRTPEVYLVPRGAGQVVIGATVERAGFDRRVEGFALKRLHRLAAEVWPPIAGAPMIDSWSGSRPGTEDGLPLIGSAGQPHSWIATGHFRNGILLAPATGLLVRQLVEGSEPETGLADFSPAR